MTGTWASRTDGELLRSGRQDVGAFEELYVRYEMVVATYLVRQCRDREFAADLTTETFAAAMVHAARFRGDGPAVGWLLAITRRTLLQSLRRGRAESRARERLGLERVEFTDESLERVDALVDAAAVRPRLDRAMHRLPPDQREAILAHVLEEHSYEALAERLGVPEATIRQRVSRGLAGLRTSLEGIPR